MNLINDGYSYIYMVALFSGLLHQCDSQNDCFEVTSSITFRQYENSCYWVSNEYDRRSWENAQIICNGFRGNLATISKKATLEFLKSHWYLINETYWIGLYLYDPVTSDDIETRRRANWKWLDGTKYDWTKFEQQTDFGWSVGEPNQEENVVRLYNGEVWKAIQNTTNDLYPFICQTNAVSSTSTSSTTSTLSTTSTPSPTSTPSTTSPPSTTSTPSTSSPPSTTSTISTAETFSKQEPIGIMSPDVPSSPPKQNEDLAPTEKAVVSSESSGSGYSRILGPVLGSVLGGVILIALALVFFRIFKRQRETQFNTLMHRLKIDQRLKKSTKPEETYSNIKDVDMDKRNVYYNETGDRGPQSRNNSLGVGNSTPVSPTSVQQVPSDVPCDEHEYTALERIY